MNDRPYAQNRHADAGMADGSRDRLSVLAEQQAALRRVAMLVAGGANPSDVFAAVAEELARCLHVPATHLLRFEPDGTGTIVGSYSQAGTDRIAVGVWCRWRAKMSPAGCCAPGAPLEWIIIRVLPVPSPHGCARRV